MVVFGYRNIDAEFYGGEVGLTLRPWRRLTIPVTFAVSKGSNRDTGVGLAEIPPWEATFAARYQQTVRTLRVWAQTGSRFVGRKSNPAQFDSPLYANTSGFALLHARGGVQVNRRFRFEAGVENLLNRRYSEYLTPSVSPFKPASGNLLPGDRVPGPGRWGWVSVGWEF